MGHESDKLVMHLVEWDIDVIVSEITNTETGMSYEMDYDSKDLKRLEITEGELREEVSQMFIFMIEDMIKRNEEKEK